MAEPAEKIPRPARWDIPFDLGQTDEAVDRLLAIPPFSAIDAARFPAKIPLRGVMKNDARIVRFKKGDIVVREGDYGDSAFFVLSGAVRVVLSRGAEGGLPPAMLGRRESKARTFVESAMQLFRSAMPEVHPDVGQRAGAIPVTAPASAAPPFSNPPDVPPTGAAPKAVVRTGENDRATGRHDQDGHAGVFLQDVPAILDRYRTARMGTGELFGEIAALGRTPRTATVFADEASELLEIRWHGLRELRRYAPAIKEHVDKIYRQNSLLVHLRETPLFKHLSADELASVAETVRFETHGDFDWYGSYKSYSAKSAAEKLEKEPLIAKEGDAPAGVILLRAGFARVSRKAGHGELTTSYLGRGQVFGLDEIAHAWKTGTAVPNQSSLRALGYVDVIFVPADVLVSRVLPRLPDELVPPLLAQPDAGGDAIAVVTAPRTRQQSVLREFLVENRFINGQATMVIDLDRCIHCDDCVDACAATHDNNPRFVRHGIQLGRHLVANACMHCVDPVCMIGCPTGAISRSLQGPVVINDATCIGCGTCARACPYDDIRMVEVRTPDGRYVVDERTNAPITLATKCDLCIDQSGGPACVRACGHDALARVDLADPGSLTRWVAQ